VALGLKEPWYVRDLSFDAKEKLLTLKVDFTKGSKFPHLDAEGLHPVYDTETKTLRHLNFFIRSHFDGVIAWAQTQQTNGFMEALNGLFQAAKRSARGYVRFSTMRTVIFLRLGKLNFSRLNPHISSI